MILLDLCTQRVDFILTTRLYPLLEHLSHELKAMSYLGISKKIFWLMAQVKAKFSMKSFLTQIKEMYLVGLEILIVIFTTGKQSFSHQFNNNRKEIYPLTEEKTPWRIR